MFGPSHKMTESITSHTSLVFIFIVSFMDNNGNSFITTMGKPPQHLFSPMIQSTQATLTCIGTHAMFSIFFALHYGNHKITGTIAGYLNKVSGYLLLHIAHMVLWNSHSQCIVDVDDCVCIKREIDLQRSPYFEIDLL